MCSIKHYLQSLHLMRYWFTARHCFDEYKAIKILPVSHYTWSSTLNARTINRIRIKNFKAVQEGSSDCCLLDHLQQRKFVMKFMTGLRIYDAIEVKKGGNLTLPSVTSFAENPKPVLEGLTPIPSKTSTEEEPFYWLNIYIEFFFKIREGRDKWEGSALRVTPRRKKLLPSTTVSHLPEVQRDSLKWCI